MNSNYLINYETVYVMLKPSSLLRVLLILLLMTLLPKEISRGLTSGRVFLRDFAELPISCIICL